MPVRFEFVKALLEGIVELEESFGVLRLLAGRDVLEALRAAALVPNAAGRNQKLALKFKPCRLNKEEVITYYCQFK